MKQRILSTLLVFDILISLLTPSFLTEVQAIPGVIKSNNYEIQLPNFNSGAGIPTSTNYNLNTTIGQTAPGLFSSSGYRVKSGFQYISSIIPFSFSISDFSIDFGTLTPGTPSTATNSLTVSSGGAGGYQVKAQANYPLQNASGSEIADTLCDAGTCSETTAEVWTSNSIYGFGFNVSGDDESADFVDSTYFRQFADASAAEAAETIMENTVVGRSRQATVTYKVNVSSTQEAGHYQNIIKYTAIPSY